MNSEKVCNTKKEVPTGISLKESNGASLVFCWDTHLTKIKGRNVLFIVNASNRYTIAMTEASNESLYQKYLNSFNKLIELQRETFETMFRKGWYCLETAPRDKIKEKNKTLETEYRDLYL